MSIYIKAFVHLNTSQQEQVSKLTINNIVVYPPAENKSTTSLKEVTDPFSPALGIPQAAGISGTLLDSLRLSLYWGFIAVQRSQHSKVIMMNHF